MPVLRDFFHDEHFDGFAAGNKFEAELIEVLHQFLIHLIYLAA